MENCNKEFYGIIVTFTNQNDRPLEIEDEVNLTLLIINRNDTNQEPRTRKYAKGYGFLSFAGNPSNKYGKQLLNNGLKALKTASKKVVHKPADVAGEFIGRKITEKKQKPVSDDVEEIIIAAENKEEI